MVAAMRRIALAAALGAVAIPALFTSSEAATTRQQQQPARSAPQPAPGQAAQNQPPAQGDAAAPKRLGEAQGWTAYSAPEKTGFLCYVVGQPTKSEPANAKRDPIHLLITHNTADKTTNVVSFIAGYAFKEGSDAEVDIGGKKFALFTKGDTAWARDAATDKAVVDAMLKGKQAVIKGSSARGTATTDTYSLAGFTQVIGEIDKACKVKR
jgi:hypothetical protein